VAELIGTLDVKERTRAKDKENGLRPLLQTWCRKRTHLHSVRTRKTKTTSKRTLLSQFKQHSSRKRTIQKERRLLCLG
jgi:hypothetical protein